MWLVNSLDLLISPTFSHSPTPCPGMSQKQLPSSKPEEEYLNLLSTSLAGLRNFSQPGPSYRRLKVASSIPEPWASLEGGKEDPLDSGGRSMWAQTSSIIH